MGKITNIFKNDKMAYFMGIVFSILLFLAIYGIQPLNVLNTSWLDKYDSVQKQFINWASFRNDNWSLPLLTAHTDFMVEERSVLWNIIPLFAIVCKALSPFLPNNFQYFGIWALINIILFAIFSVRIFKRFIDDNIKVIIANIILVLLTLLMGRMFVFSPLNAQWIVLACFIIFDKSIKEQLSDKELLIIFLVLALISSFIHIYFSLICVSFSVGIVVYRLLRNEDKRVNLQLIVGGLAISIVVALLLYADMEILLKRENVSYIIPEISLYYTHDDLYKSYIGMGDIGFVAYVIYAFFSKEKLREWFLTNWKKNVAIIVLMITIAILVVFPFEVMVTKNDNSLNTAYWSILVSVITPVFISYIGMVVAIVYIVKNKIFKNILLVGAIIISLQFDNIAAVVEDSFWNNGENIVSFEEEIWADIASNEQIEKVAMLNRVQDAQTIWRWAVENNKEINSYIRNVSEEKYEDLLEKPENDTVLIFDREDQSISYWKYKRLNYYLVDDYIIAYSNEFKGIEQASLLEILSRKFDMNNEFYFDGEVVGSVKILFPGGESYGPYCELPEGLYEVKIKGDYLKNNVSINIYSDSTNKSYEYTIEKRKYNKIVLQVRFEEDIDSLQFIIDNNSDKDVQLNYIKIIPLELVK